ncbi:MAG: hypothetical protein AAB267_09020, partial [Candidatus Desantisbacteria bacterium]
MSVFYTFWDMGYNLLHEIQFDKMGIPVLDRPVIESELRAAYPAPGAGPADAGVLKKVQNWESWKIHYPAEKQVVVLEIIDELDTSKTKKIPVAPPPTLDIPRLPPYLLKFTDPSGKDHIIIHQDVDTTRIKTSSVLKKKEIELAGTPIQNRTEPIEQRAIAMVSPSQVIPQTQKTTVQVSGWVQAADKVVAFLFGGGSNKLMAQTPPAPGASQPQQQKPEVKKPAKKMSFFESAIELFKFQTIKNDFMNAYNNLKSITWGSVKRDAQVFMQSVKLVITSPVESFTNWITRTKEQVTKTIFIKGSKAHDIFESWKAFCSTKDSRTGAYLHREQPNIIQVYPIDPANPLRGYKLNINNAQVDMLDFGLMMIDEPFTPAVTDIDQVQGNVPMLYWSANNKQYIINGAKKGYLDIAEDMRFKTRRFYRAPLDEQRALQFSALLEQGWEDHGMRYIIPYQAGLDKKTPRERADINALLREAPKVAQLYSDGGGLLFYQVGNEDNLHIRGAPLSLFFDWDAQKFFMVRNAMAGAIKDEEKRISQATGIKREHPVMIGLGDLPMHFSYMSRDSRVMPYGINTTAEWQRGWNRFGDILNNIQSLPDNNITNLEAKLKKYETLLMDPSSLLLK